MADELIKVAEDSARSGFFLISGTALSTVILAIGSILTGRFLGPELYGQYTLALVIPSLLLTFTDLGINQGITKFTASLKSKGETKRLARIIEYGLLLRASTGIAIFIINYVFADIFSSFFLQRPDLAFYIRIASTSILFQVIFSTATSAFVGLDKTEYNALSANVQALAKTIISISLVLLGFGVAGAIIGYVTSYIVAAIAGIALLFLMIREKQDVKDSYNISDDLKTLMRYGAPLYISVLLTSFVPLYQNFILAIFTTDTDIGNYKAAANFTALVAVLSVPITTALLPAFSKLDSETNNKIEGFFKLANKYTAMIILPIAFLLILLSNEIVEIVYGSTYQPASLFLAIFCLTYFLVGLGYLTLSSFFNGLGETKTTLKASIIALIALIVLSPALTKTYSVPGLIIASLIASTASTIYGAYIARKNFQIKFDVRSIVRIYLISAVCSIPLLVFHFTHLPALFNVPIGGLLYLITYATLTPLAGIMTIPEIQMAKRITQKIPLLKLFAKPLLKYEENILRMIKKK
ncbi:flippase [Candidatus Bathyarchaeota archaeon]|nr:flippase [Candidatus Bathyarchaeota archaeon]